MDLEHWLTFFTSFTLLQFFIPSCPCCTTPAAPCDGCSDEWTYPDSGDIGTENGTGNFSESPDNWTGVGWTTPGNAATSDNAYATITLTNATSAVLQGTTCGFNIHEDATIVGIEVTIERSRVGDETLELASLKLVKNGTIQGNDKQDAVAWPDADASITYGGAADLWGLTLIPADVNANDFGVALSVTTTGTNEQARVDLVTIKIYFTGADGCGFQETSGTWDVVNFRMRTTSSNARAIATFTPAAADFHATFEWALNSAGDQGFFIFNWLDASNYSYVEFRASGSGTGRMAVIDVVAGTPTTVAELTEADVGSAFIPPGTLMTVNVCLTPTLIYVSWAAGACLRTSGSWGQVGFGFGTGTNSGDFIVNFVFVQENGVDGDGNPCGCEAPCTDCVAQEYRLDMTGWANVHCSVCDDLNTSIYLRFDCGQCFGISSSCASDPTEGSTADTCFWSFCSDDLFSCAGLPLTNLLAATVAFAESDIYLTILIDDATYGIALCQTYNFQQPSFTRSTECNTLNNKALPFSSECHVGFFERCDGSAITVDITAV